MCGRYDVTDSPQMLMLYFALDEIAGDYSNSDVRPTNLAPIIRIKDGRRLVRLARWGLIPNWWKAAKPPQNTFNARGESVFEKPMFRSAAKHYRCLVPVSAFFEWQAIAGQKKKQKLRFASPDGNPLALAGLWARWKQPETGEAIDSYTVITTQANNFMTPVHDRMPVVLSQSDWAAWLDPDTSNPPLLQSMLEPCANDALVMTEVA